MHDHMGGRRIYVEYFRWYFKYFNASELKECLEDGTIFLSPLQPMTNDGMPTSKFILADDVFSLRIFLKPYIRRVMMTSSNGNIFRVTGSLCHKDQWRGTLMCSLICGWANSWANNGDAGDLRLHRAQCDVVVILWLIQSSQGCGECIRHLGQHLASATHHVFTNPRGGHNREWSCSESSKSHEV